MADPKRRERDGLPGSHDRLQDDDLDETVRLTDAGKALFQDNAARLSDAAFVHELIRTIFGDDVHDPEFSKAKSDQSRPSVDGSTDA